MRTTHDLTARPVPIGDLILHPLNARDHDLPTITESLQTHGQFALVYRQKSTGYVIKGNGTTEAALGLGWPTLDVVTLDIDDDQANRILAIDNRASDKATYHEDALTTLLESFGENLGGTGFEADDLAELLATVAGDLPAPRNMLVTDLHAHPRNYQEHPDDQIEQIMASIRQVGFYRSIVTARDFTILAGHGVAEAARRLGRRFVPVIVLDLDPNEPRALKVLVSDNETGNAAVVADRDLAGLLREIMSSDPFSLAGSGYTAEQLAALEFLIRPPAGKGSDEWTGLPEFSGANPDPALVIRFDSIADRDRYIVENGFHHVATRGAVTRCWWPDRPGQRTAMLQFEADEPESTLTASESSETA